MRKIVLDTDGVILNFGDNYVSFAEKLLGRKLNHNATKYPLQDLLQVSKEEAEYVWSKFNSMNEWERIPEYDDTKHAIELINEYKLEVYIVTSIDKEHQESRKKNLNNIGLFPKEIICVGSNHGHKNKVISEIKPIAFVDDRLDHLYRSQDVEHLVWIDQKQEQVIDFNDYHAKVSSLYEWTRDFLPAIINNEEFKNDTKNIRKKEVYKSYDECKVTIYQYLKDISEKNILTQEELKSFNELINNIFNIRKHKSIDENFINFFKENEIDNTANFANLMGADVGSLELNGLKVVFTNCEFGVNIAFNNPKDEDVMTYWQMCEIFNLGLENPEQGKKLLTHFKLEENLEIKNIKTIKTKI